MPVDVSFSNDGETAFMRCRGLVRGSELVEANEQMYNPVRLPLLREQFVDFSEAEHFQINPEEARRIARQDIEAAQINPRMAAALIAPTDVAFETCRMWESLVSESYWPTKVCRDYDEAEIWLSSVASYD